MTNLRNILSNTTFRIISTPSNDTSFERISALLIGMGIKVDSIEKYEAKMIPTNPSLGCNLSHSGALVHYPETGYLCVLEDDVDIFIRFDDETLDIEFPDDATDKWDSIYLGLSGWGYFEDEPTKARLNNLFCDESEILSEIFIRVRNMFSAHAIIYMNKEYTDKISSEIRLNSIPNYIEPNDVSNAKSQMNNYCVALRIPLFYQMGEHEYCTKIEFNGKR